MMYSNVNEESAVDSISISTFRLDSIAVIKLNYPSIYTLETPTQQFLTVFQLRTEEFTGVFLSSRMFPFPRRRRKRTWVDYLWLTFFFPLLFVIRAPFLLATKPAQHPYKHNFSYIML